MPTKEDRIEELVSLYSVGSISQEELRELEEYLGEDREKVAALIKENEEAASLLSLNVDDVTPPSHVKDNILKRVKIRKNIDNDNYANPLLKKFRPLLYGLAGAAAAVLLLFVFNGYISGYVSGISRSQYTALTRKAGQQTEKISSLENELVSKTETIKSLREREDELNSRVAELDKKVKNSQDQVNDLTARLENMNVTVDSMKTRIASRDDQLSKYSDLLDYLRNPDVVVIDLSNLKSNLNSLGRVLWNKQQDSAIFYGLNLPVIPKDKVYQLWAIIGSKPVSCGIFDVDNQGNGKVRIPNLENSGNIHKFAVTLEPAGGVSSPTGEMYLAGSISDKL